MYTHIDWVTFTIPMVYFGQENDAYASAISAGFEDLLGLQMRDVWFAGTWEPQERSRAPYTDAWVLKGEGITLFASPNLTHACVEISGQGCARLHAGGVIYDLLARCKERVTRIDVACDIETDVRPLEFVGAVKHERMRTSGHVVSDTGETCYVGSQKSERYARVYRYNLPHPRANLLRVEHVFRKDYAKKVALALSCDSIEQVAKSSGDAFGWCHTIWQPSTNNGSDLSIVKERGNAGGTIFWLVHSVAPAFKKLVDIGAIDDPESFIRKYFLEDGGE